VRGICNVGTVACPTDEEVVGRDGEFSFDNLEHVRRKRCRECEDCRCFWEEKADSVEFTIGWSECRLSMLQHAQCVDTVDFVDLNDSDLFDEFPVAPTKKPCESGKVAVMLSELFRSGDDLRVVSRPNFLEGYVW
jgi:hypothetical protein